MANYSYDPAKVLVLVSGVIMKGFSESETVEIDDKEDRFTVKTGVDGTDSTFVKSNNREATIKISLMENSLSVLALSAITKLAELSGTAFPIMVSNLNTGRTHFAAACMLMKKPAEKPGQKDIPTLEYTFITSEVATSP